MDDHRADSGHEQMGVRGPCSVDGTLLEASASHKSFKPTDTLSDDPPPVGRNTEIDFHGQIRYETHEISRPPILKRREGRARQPRPFAG